MKPPSFRHHAPTTVDEALDVLAEHGHDAKVLAGGQSLVPILNMRLAAPGHLVDINRIGALSHVTTTPETVTVGALARHAEVERDEAAWAAIPLLRQALQLVAHPVVRNRGTTVGSLVHADPSGELTAVLALLGGSVELARRGSTRTVAAADFFVGPLESSLQEGELAMSATFPVPARGSGTSFVEVARRHGDYAVCGLAAEVVVGEDGQVTSARAAYISVAPTPLVLDLTDAVGGRPARAADWSAAGLLARGQVDPEPDIHASADYRAHLVEVLTARALAQAAGRTTAVAA